MLGAFCSRLVLCSVLHACMTAKISYAGLHVLQAGGQDDSDDSDDLVIAFLEAEMRKDPAGLEPTGFQDLVSRFSQLADVPQKQVGTRKHERPGTQAFHALHYCHRYLWHVAVRVIPAMLHAMNSIERSCSAAQLHPFLQAFMGALDYLF